MKINKIIHFYIIAILALGMGAIGFFGLQNMQFNAVTAVDLQLDEQEATIKAIKEVSPAVVSIIINDYQDVVVIGNGKAQMQKEKKEVGSGTGFIISPDGYILTNKHMVMAGDPKTAEYQIILNSGKRYYAQYIGVDPLKDLGILKIFDKNLPSVKLGDSDKLVQGISVIAIGNALGRYQNTVTKGIISALGRSIEASDAKGNIESLDNVVQTDAEINPGNSGGPLIDLNGEVVGINTAVDSQSSNIGFAISINDAKVIIKSIREEDRIVRPRIGIRYVMLTPELAAENNLTRDSGALVIKGKNGEPAILSDAPAGKGGIQEGDIIFEINAIKVEGNNTLFNIIQKYKPGDRVGLKIQRGDKIIIRIITLDEFK
ncbi:MAG: trypsin-like peptidase domain-containing protein [Patescibacteria group bacterium]|jgi:S1-C subfamily serine protease